jgi:two-component system, NtrC family, sensor histidine kinase HydH
VIRTELHRLDGVVRQFVNLAGPSSVNLQPINVAELLQHVCRLLEPEATKRQIVLMATRASELPEVWADPVQLTQALVNLVINAIQAVERDGRVEVSAAFDVATEQVIIVVRDTGPGIDPQKRLAVFEPFFTTKPEGSGLGLWIVQQIAMAHGGTVAAGNAAEGGAVFTLRLPRRAKETTS